MKPLKDRFMSRVNVSQCGCWIWDRGSRGAKRQYGTIQNSGKTLLAHRVAYELFVGPIPNGLTIDHLCRNTLCVNPAHLEAVSCTENILRGECPPAQNKRKTHCKRGHLLPETAERKGGRVHRRCRECKIEDRPKDAAQHRERRRLTRLGPESQDNEQETK